jgi:hypothetical protein
LKKLKTLKPEKNNVEKIIKKKDNALDAAIPAMGAKPRKKRKGAPKHFGDTFSMEDITKG